MDKIFGRTVPEKTLFAMIAPAFRSRYRNFCFNLYPFAKLHDLINEVSHTEVDLDEDSLYKIRFVMNQHFQVWFSKEGPPSSITPGHGQMLEKEACICAGVLRFSKSFDILEIDHKSGDFRPDFNSLQWFLLALAVNIKSIKIQLPQMLYLLKLDSNGGNQSKYELSIESILNWAKTVQKQQIDQLVEQTIEKKIMISSSNSSQETSPNYPVRNLAIATSSSSSSSHFISAMSYNKNNQTSATSIYHDDTKKAFK